jgi:hypothetical protein
MVQNYGIQDETRAPPPSEKNKLIAKGVDASKLAKKEIIVVLLISTV